MVMHLNCIHCSHPKIIHVDSFYCTSFTRSWIQNTTFTVGQPVNCSITSNGWAMKTPTKNSNGLLPPTSCMLTNSLRGFFIFKYKLVVLRYAYVKHSTWFNYK